MGEIFPLDPFPLLWILSSQFFICVHLQLVIHFIHYIQFTSFAYYITLALGHTLHLQYTSLVLGLKTWMLLSSPPTNYIVLNAHIHTIYTLTYIKTLHQNT
jgi:hypothetical protein